jgi:hypothetical protein
MLREGLYTMEVILRTAY